MAKVSRIWATNEHLWYEELKVIAPYREYQYDFLQHVAFSKFVPVLQRYSALMLNTQSLRFLLVVYAGTSSCCCINDMPV